VLAPALAAQAVRAAIPGMAEVAERLVARWDHADEVDVSEEMTRVTLDVIGLCGFGYRFDCLGRDDDHPFIARLKRCMARVPERAASLLGDPGQVQWEDDVRAMHQMVDEVIAERRRAEQGPSDLLSCMLRGLDDRNVRFQVLTSMVAGHDTTTGALSFAIYFLAKHPEILARARAEVDAVLGDAAPTFETVGRLRYVAQVLKEAMRLWPPGPGFNVAPFADETVCGRFPIARDKTVTIFVPALHRDPAVWGDHVERFDPDRFSPENEKRRPATAYRPFGNGPRACLGQFFAMQEAALILAVILRRYELVDFADYSLKLLYRVTLKPEDFRLRVRRRITSR